MFIFPSPTYTGSQLFSLVILLVSGLLSTHLSLPLSQMSPSLPKNCRHLTAHVYLHSDAHFHSNPCSPRSPTAFYAAYNEPCPLIQCHPTQFWIKLNSVLCVWVPVCLVSRAAFPTSTFQFSCGSLLFESQGFFFFKLLPHTCLLSSGILHIPFPLPQKWFSNPCTYTNTHFYPTVCAYPLMS